MRFLFSLILCLHLMAPIAAWAQASIKSPLSYSLQEYGIVLAISMMGGLVRWFLALRRGELVSLTYLIGELATSAFVGLLTFWACEAMSINPLLTPCAVGMMGHLGAKGLVWAEMAGRRSLEKRLGLKLEDTGNAPLGKN